MREQLMGVIIGLLMVLPVGVQAAERVVVEGVLVRVNDRIITISDFTERVRQELTQMPTPPNNEELRQFTDMLLDEMVNELVLMERATEKRLTVDDEMVDQAIENLRKADLKRIVCTDSIPLEPEQLLPHTEVLSVAPLLGEAIKRIHRNESVSRHFR